MSRKRIESTTSRTAEWSCISRAMSSLETSDCYRSDDHIAALLLPSFVGLLIRVQFFRKLFVHRAPQGFYEWVIARTKYIDAVFKQALTDRFDQILFFGAGFDTRAMRFQDQARETKMFELDVPVTQDAKIRQYRKRGISVPRNVVFIPIDFDKESLPVKLEQVGFGRNHRSLFILEGLLMYLQPESVDKTFRTLQDFAGDASEIVFDYVYASVLRHENIYYGESGIVESGERAGEQWHFGIEKGEVEQFLSTYDLKLIDHKDAHDLEEMYFKDASGKIVGRVNGTHCLVRAGKV